MNCKNYFIYTLAILSVAALFFTNISHAQYAQLENKPYIHPELNFKIRLFKDWSLLSPSVDEKLGQRMILKLANPNNYRTLSEKSLAKHLWAFSLHRFNITENNSYKQPSVSKKQNDSNIDISSVQFVAPNTFEEMLKKLDFYSFPEGLPLYRTTVLSERTKIATDDGFCGSFWQIEQALPRSGRSQLNDNIQIAKIFRVSIFAANLRSEDEEYGFLFVCPSYRFKEVKPTFVQLVQSFEFPKKTENKPATERSSFGHNVKKGTRIKVSGTNVDRKSNTNTTLLSRKSERQALIKKAIKSLPKEWKVRRTKHFIVLTNASNSFTGNIIKKIEAIRRWLDKNLNGITEIPALTGIVRIFKNYEEHQSYCETSVDSYFSYYSSLTKEVLVYEGCIEVPKSRQFRQFCTGILAQWLEDKYEDLYFETPLWLSTGLGGVLASAKENGNNLDFRISPKDRVNLREYSKKGELYVLRSLFQLSIPDFRKDEARAACQSAHVVLYLISSKALSAGAHNFLADYFRHTICAINRKRELADKMPPKVDRQKAWNGDESSRQMGIDMLNFVTSQTFETFFKNWTLDDWKKFNTRVLSTLKQ